MAEITHDLPIAASRAAVYAAVTSPSCLDAWWTLHCEGIPVVGTPYLLYFGEGYDWRGRVVRAEADQEFAIEITVASGDWVGTTVSFRLEQGEGMTWLRFRHAGWADASDHFRITSYCWALYLRLLRRWVERGEVVPYEHRLEA